MDAVYLLALQEASFSQSAENVFKLVSRTLVLLGVRTQHLMESMLLLSTRLKYLQLHVQGLGTVRGDHQTDEGVCLWELCLSLYAAGRAAGLSCLSEI